MLTQQFLYDLDRAALALFFVLAPLHHNVPAFSSHLHVGTSAQEGVTANLLAALHRLQQKSVWLVGRNRQKGGNRRQQVGRDRLHDRDQRGLVGQAGKFFVIGTKHGRSNYIEKGAHGRETVPGRSL